MVCLTLFFFFFFFPKVNPLPCPLQIKYNQALHALMRYTQRRHGIAFDNGALDRVVRAGQDDEELQRLDLFVLGATVGGSIASPVPSASKIRERGSGRNLTLVPIQQDDKTTIMMSLDVPAVAGEPCVG